MQSNDPSLPSDGELTRQAVPQQPDSGQTISDQSASDQTVSDLPASIPALPSMPALSSVAAQSSVAALSSDLALSCDVVLNDQLQESGLQPALRKPDELQSDDEGLSSLLPSALPVVATADAVRLASRPDSRSEPQPQQLAYSTFLSLLVVLILIITIRFTVPPLVESLRYSWYRGQLRAEYELSGQRLQNVSLNSLSEASELVSRRVGPSVVHINLLEVHSSSKKWLFGGTERMEMMGQGSGVILDSAGHILTNHHVIEDAGRIEVSLSDGRRVIAQELGRDPFTDLAVIKIEADGLMPAEWGDSNRMDVGSPVWAVGSPFGLERTVTFGILSGKHRIDLKGTRRWDNRDDKETMYSDLMQSDVAVNPGNSGGPLVNSSGQIIGINTAIVGETYIGISFAIPSNVARRVAEGLIKEGEVQRGWLGLSFKSGEDEFGESPRGAMVDKWANSESPAKQAGIMPGDLIVKFDGREVATYRSLTAMVAQTDIGTIVPIEVIRDGKPLTLQVEIGRRPNLQGDPR